MTGLLLVEPNRRYAAEVVVMLSSMKTKLSEYNNGRRACDLLEVKRVHRKVLDRNSMLLDPEYRKGDDEESKLVTECEDVLRKSGQLQESEDGGAGLRLPQIFIDGIFAGDAHQLQGLEDNGLLGRILRRELCVKCAVETGTVVERSSDQYQCDNCGGEFKEVLPEKKMIDNCIIRGDQEVLDEDCNSGSEDRFNRYAKVAPKAMKIQSKKRLWEKGGKFAPKAPPPLARSRDVPLCKLRGDFGEAPLTRISSVSSADAGRKILGAALQMQSDDESAEKKYAKPGETTYPLEALKRSSSNCPKDVDPSKKEAYLSDVDFHDVFKMDLAKFGAMPRWRQDKAKKDNGLY